MSLPASYPVLWQQEPLYMCYVVFSLFPWFSAPNSLFSTSSLAKPYSYFKTQPKELLGVSGATMDTSIILLLLPTTHGSRDTLWTDQWSYITDSVYLYLPYHSERFLG